jgi:hypothetical protein
MNTPTPNLANAMMERLAAHNASRAEHSRLLWRMSAAERKAAMWRGELTGAQLIEWARRAPDEVPLIDGEFAFIAAQTPEVAEAERPPAPATTAKKP